MSYLVLARKWRPQSFDDLVGQEHITRTLRHAIAANRIAHAYLFTGMRGVGKTTAARILAKALNCETGPSEEPCNRCSQCREIAAGSAIDVLEIDGASNRGIDEVRQIIESVRYQPAKSRFKIYIIDEVHQVTKEAFNALLKTLEEPPAWVKFILATTEPHRLPETIVSRCQRFDFRRIALRDIVERLRRIGSDEGFKITDGALVLLAREADGSMRDAQSLLEAVLARVGPAGTVDEALLKESVGLGDRGPLYAISRAVFDGDARQCVEIVAQAVAEGRDLGRLSKDLVEHFRNLVIARLTAGKPRRDHGESASATQLQLLDLPDHEVSELAAQAADVPVETLLDYFDFMAAGDEEVARSGNPRFALEAVLVRLATLPKTVPVTELIERLERLEGRLAVDHRRTTTPARLEAPVVSTAAAPLVTEVSGDGADRESRWREFVAFVRKQKKLLASHLESGNPLEFGAGRLKIGIAERHHLSYLQDPETLSALRTFARQFFAADVAVTIAQVEPPKSELGRDSDVPEGAKAAQRILGGTIKTVRRDS
ncbi:MAG TPA: DNA polymerase III subunit gamma/tau [Candidatus Eisenbacteria bacterium]|nr:DNA polymerase III subunit gamma/tau [Candidatus Eisenbacteria bacterium]